MRPETATVAPANIVTAPPLSPEDQARRDRGGQVLGDLGIAHLSGARVVPCPFGHGGETVADLAGVQSEKMPFADKLRAAVEEAKGKGLEGEELADSVLNDLGGLILRDEKSEVQYAYGAPDTDPAADAEPKKKF